MELIFSILGEVATTEITRTKDAQGFPESKTAATEGGAVAGNARRQVQEVAGFHKTDLRSQPSDRIRQRNPPRPLSQFSARSSPKA